MDRFRLPYFFSALSGLHETPFFRGAESMAFLARRFPHLCFIPLEPYPARFARHLPHAGKAYDTGCAFLSFVFMPARVLLLFAIPQSRFPVCKEDFSLRSK